MEDSSQDFSMDLAVCCAAAGLLFGVKFFNVRMGREEQTISCERYSLEIHLQPADFVYRQEVINHQGVIVVVWRNDSKSVEIARMGAVRFDDVRV